MTMHFYVVSVYRWWQGMLEHPEDNNNNSSNGSGAGVNNDEDGSGAKWGTILSPMQGLNMNLHR